jgi:hypothetical protein
MQKFDFVKNLEKISENLFSQEVLTHFENAINQPGSNYQFGNLRPTLFSSKSRYDQLIKDPDIFEILKKLDSDEIYSEANLSLLTGYLSTQQIGNIFMIKQCLAFYKFHLTIISTLNISKDLLLKSSYSESNEQTLQNGIIIFEIVIEEDSKDIDLYIKVLSLLNELASFVDKVSDSGVNSDIEEGEDKNNVEIILLDSGSNSNIGLKTGIETAKSLFLIFKEIWDFVVSHKQYQSKQKNDTLLESLTIRKAILTKLEEGVITENEAKEYTHIIKTRAEDLIGLKVLPKELIQKSHEIDNKKLLDEFKELRLLNQKK